MFTLIIPYHNREKFLPRTLQSITKCTHLPASILLVDNGSTDRSAAVCSDFAASHPNLHVTLMSEGRKGASAARNAGLAKVVTEWVYFFDSDDELDSDYFEAVCRTLTDKPQTDVVACATKMVFADGSTSVRSVQYSNKVTDQLLSGQLATQGMFFRTDFLRSIGGWNDSLPKWNDWELGVRVLIGGAQIVWLRRKAFHHLYQHANSLTGKNYADTADGIYQAIDAVRKLISKNPLQTYVLACRCMLVAGTLYREGAAEKADAMYTYGQALVKNRHRVLSKVYLRLLCNYVRMKGRGGWLLVRKTLPLVKFLV